MKARSKRVTPENVSALVSFLEEAGVKLPDRIPKDSIGILFDTVNDRAFIVENGYVSSISTAYNEGTHTQAEYEMVLIQEARLAWERVRQRVYSRVKEENVVKFAEDLKAKRDEAHAHQVKVLKFCKDYGIIK